jgi:hypothetical protein
MIKFFRPVRQNLLSEGKTELQAVAFFDKIIISKSVIIDSIDFYFNRLDFGLQPTSNRGPYDALKSSGIR